MLFIRETIISKTFFSEIVDKDLEYVPYFWTSVPDLHN